MRLLRLILVFALLAMVAPAQAGQRITVFAAASLSDVMQSIGTAFEKVHGTPVRFSFAASSTLARQIETGAPADIYASANTAWMSYLQGRGLIFADSVTVPVRNSLALVGNRMRFQHTGTLAQALDELRAGERLVIGDPAHVPAGIYAQQALIALGLWQGLRPRLAYASDVRAALALVARGEAPLGLTYLTDVPIGGPDVILLQVVTPGTHDRIDYPFGIASGHATTDTRAFMAFLWSDAARQIFRQAGFQLAPRND
ncbi:MAG: molybdate ABC transporter substrate-binding protein [Minwuia sp.]|nr:molybdate ABC transporter substrate-binding protein [Minwuia sp.]